MGVERKKNAYGNNGKQDWCTPQWFIMEIEKKLGVKFTLDVCARDRGVAVCHRFFTPADNGLQQKWETERGVIWCNPPWDNVEPWIKKAKEAAKDNTVFMLLPASIETLWCQEHSPSAHTYLVTPRLNYWDPDKRKLWSGVAKASMLWQLDRSTLWTHTLRKGNLMMEYLYVPKPTGATR